MTLNEIDCSNPLRSTHSAPHRNLVRNAAALIVSSSLSLGGCSTIKGALEEDADGPDLDTVAVAYGKRVGCYDSDTPHAEQKTLCVGLVATAISELAADRVVRYEPEDAAYVSSLITQMKTRWVGKFCGTEPDDANPDPDCSIATPSPDFLHADLADMRTLFLLALERGARRQAKSLIEGTSDAITAGAGPGAGVLAGAGAGPAAAGAVAAVALPKLFPDIADSTALRILGGYLRKSSAFKKDIGQMMSQCDAADGCSDADYKKIAKAVRNRMLSNLKRVQKVTEALGLS